MLPSQNDAPVVIIGVRFDSMILNKSYRQGLFYEMLALQTIGKVDPVQHGPRNRKLNIRFLKLTDDAMILD